jgi:hypothetical protein
MNGRCHQSRLCHGCRVSAQEAGEPDLLVDLVLLEVVQLEDTALEQPARLIPVLLVQAGRLTHTRFAVQGILFSTVKTAPCSACAQFLEDECVLLAVVLGGCCWVG